MDERFPLSARIAAAVALTALVALLALLLAPSASERLIAAGDEVCRENNARLARISRREEGVPLEDTGRALVAATRLNAPGIDTTRRLAALLPPPTLREEYDRFVALRRERDLGQARVIAALVKEDPDAAAEAQADTVALTEGPLRKAAEAVGFRVCGQPLETAAGA